MKIGKKEILISVSGILFVIALGYHYVPKIVIILAIGLYCLYIFLLFLRNAISGILHQEVTFPSRNGTVHLQGPLAFILGIGFFIAFMMVFIALIATIFGSFY